MAPSSLTWRFHAERDVLLAEAHARPSTPVAAPMLATRIAALSGESGAKLDRDHMAALCRKIGAAEPGPNARWCVVDAATWRLRWERHTEVSTWTFFRPKPDPEIAPFAVTALDLAPQDWLAALPGEVMAAAHVELLRETPRTIVFAEDMIGSAVAGGMAQVTTDFRPGPDGFTRFVVVQEDADTVLGGHILQQLMEIESYRLLALLAFPLAWRAGTALSELEAGAAAAANRMLDEGGVQQDRQLLERLAALAGQAESLTGETSYRFAAARAYHGLVQERIRQLNETPLGNRPTIGEFMARRLAPAMRTCIAMEDRLKDVSDRVSRTTQLLSTRVSVQAEQTNLNLLESMNRRAQLQLQLQETVEGLSVVAISYYLMGLIKVLLEGVGELRHTLNPTLATGLLAPFVVLLVWRLLHRIRMRIEHG